MAEYASSIEIDARPDEVFDFLVTEEGMTAWMGEHAELDLSVGGEFAVDIAGYAVRGRYLEIDRPYRVVFSWGMTGNPALPPGASKVAFTLTPTAQGGTRVDLMHSDLPETEVAGHLDGWTHFLSRLRIVAKCGDPGRDSWVPLPIRIQQQEGDSHAAGKQQLGT
jgi:uncharacterized protein YndB with AHSA1/START domain